MNFKRLIPLLSTIAFLSNLSGDTFRPEIFIGGYSASFKIENTVGSTEAILTNLVSNTNGMVNASVDLHSEARQVATFEFIQRDGFIFDLGTTINGDGSDGLALGQKVRLYPASDLKLPCALEAGRVYEQEVDLIQEIVESNGTTTEIATTTTRLTTVIDPEVHSITVPAGTFQTIKTTETRQSETMLSLGGVGGISTLSTSTQTTVQWLALNVGRVRLETESVVEVSILGNVLSTEEETESQELVSYTNPGGSYTAIDAVGESIDLCGTCRAEGASEPGPTAAGRPELTIISSFGQNGEPTVNLSFDRTDFQAAEGSQLILEASGDLIIWEELQRFPATGEPSLVESIHDPSTQRKHWYRVKVSS